MLIFLHMGFQYQNNDFPAKGSHYQANVDFSAQEFPISDYKMLTFLHKGSQYQPNVDFPAQGFPISD